MEGKKEAAAARGSSSELFAGRREPAGLFDSVFSPPISSAQVVSRRNPCSVLIGSPSLRGHANQPGSSQTAAARGKILQEVQNRELALLLKDQSPIFPTQKHETFSLSSSIYYGGQDICVQPNPPESLSNNKDGGDEDIGIAHRGNWWQGSLYY